MTRIKTVRERTSVPSQLAGIVAVVVPPLGLVAAVWLLWDRGVRPVDLVLLAGFYVACGLGITVGFHRLFTHKSFETSAPLRAALGDPRLAWRCRARSPSGSPTTASTTRSPTGPATRTPRTPGTATRWPSTSSACGTRTSAGSSRPRASSAGSSTGATSTRTGSCEAIDRLYLLWVALTLGLPFLAGYLVGGSWQRGLEAMVWAGLVRIFLFQHVTFSINSICHFFGEQPFRTRDESRNVWLLAIPSFGESWHNGHHAFPASAVHGLEPGQLDISALVIRGMEKLRLASEVKRPDSQQIERRRVVAE